MYYLEIQDKFIAQFANTPVIVRAPGRINLIGEHTDYNEGFVLPAAIDKEMVFALAKNNLHTCRVHALDKKETFVFELNQLARSDKTWPNYIMGVVAQFQKAGYELGGFDCLFGGEIPIGSGMSSSAALECALAIGLCRLFNLEIDKLKLAKMTQQAEHEYAGVNCGIMDQFTTLFARKEQVIRLDCRTLEYEYFPLQLQNFRIVLCDTRVHHALASSEYNHRQWQCIQGLETLRKRGFKVKSLRDVKMDLLKSHKKYFDHEIYKRCEYVVQENQRVKQACRFLKEGNLEAFGDMMLESHYGLRDLYQVSCDELDLLQMVAERSPGVIGSRMMGAGFGGCTINIVHSEALDDFSDVIVSEYKKVYREEPQLHVCELADGASVIEMVTEQVY
ncbi:galactokinase [Rapidithrix thailandica]|uniref:Galactokinase n=1 Tax=Rapidithrix thailandica TaxID=413964 RepID=A0AAW9RTT1_9BACT